MAKRHPLQNLLAPLLLPLSWLYGAAGRWKRARSQVRWKPKSPCVAVGNILWGGTGKTPVTDWLLSWADRHDIRAAVLTRGYGA
ncbi:MAG: tetraacyldisaccharide 4'-kinase, partial [Mailhella sp.]|nr:tetraacyldisaccharide 4'-kinase [Mailhella sp.]